MKDPLIFQLFGSIFLFIMSVVFFQWHKKYRQMCRLDPPDYIYRKNNLDLDMKGEILWETPEAELTGEDRSFALGALFFFKWGFFAGGWFLFAAFLQSFLPKIMK
jgi:hypothetical protein